MTQHEGFPFGLFVAFFDGLMNLLVRFPIGSIGPWWLDCVVERGIKIEWWHLQECLFTRHDILLDAILGKEVLPDTTSGIE